MSAKQRGSLPLFWSRRAHADLQEIADFIARDDEQSAARWIERLLAAAEQAAHMPQSGRRVPEFCREEIREVLLKNYQVVYLVQERKITVLAVFESHRLMGDL